MLNFSLNVNILLFSKLNNWPHFSSRTLHIHTSKEMLRIMQKFCWTSLQKTLNLPNIYRRDLKWWLCRNFAFLERFLRKSAKKSVALANSELLLNNRPNQFRIGWFAKPMCNINVLIGEKVFWYTILTTCQLQPAMKKVFPFTLMLIEVDLDLVWPSTTLQKGF